MSKAKKKDNNSGGDVPIDFQVESKNLQYTITLKENEIEMLQREHVKDTEKIKSLKDEIEKLNQDYIQRYKLENDIKDLRSKIEELEKDKDDLKKKVDETKKKGDEEINKYFNEIEIFRMLNHKNLIQYYGNFKYKKGKYCIVMEYADDGDLETKIVNQRIYLQMLRKAKLLLLLNRVFQNLL